MKLYDTLSGQKRDFVPAGDPVKMYVCGITPYAPAHIGHALSYVIFDVLRRYLEFKGYRVRHVQNFTDVDDKVIQRAAQEGTTTSELTQRFIDDFFSNMDALNVLRAHVYPKATQEVPRMVEVISRLIEKGHAYVAGGDVYFRVRSDEDYGKLSHRSLEGMMAGARVEPGVQKEDPLDFALWKAAKPGEPSWDSPWGPGRPGWHIECTSMAITYLGEQLDIHGGGQDLVFPHHENEIAQSESYTGKVPFARFWVHNGLLHLGESKMSKSLGNLITIKDALQRHTPDALRLYFLSSHYRGPFMYSDDGLNAMERAAERLRGALEARDGSGPALDPAPFRERFLQAMDDDLNTPEALAALFDLVREINRAREQGKPVARAQEALRELGGRILGLTFRPPATEEALAAQPFIDLLVETRNQLRAIKQFTLADRIRDRLAELGVVLEDTPQGTRWKHRTP